MTGAAGQFLHWPLVASLAGWIALAVMPALPDLSRICGAPLFSLPRAESLRLLLALHPPDLMVRHSLLMVVTMMLPMLVVPLAHIGNRAVRFGGAAQMLFLLGYCALWILAFVPLMIVAWLARQALGPGLSTLLGVVLICAWQESGAKWRALSRCHVRPALGGTTVALFGDALRYGIGSARWCIQSCWLVMFLCLISEDVTVMAALTLALGYERYVDGRPVRLTRLVMRLRHACSDWKPSALPRPSAA
ncbi:copper chaperone [Sphingobium sp. YR768]|uniref:copper chaperone n=1 Tax=Sphingobium sp. YR768 TaxID=1884365 RepID=UPI0008B35CAA|nr:DUF2182 domain-containing protein [Sphingobium sp. YR768]SER38362.1 Predicted metal-binding integral membrane protein [Sphingobium sp. YR768]